MLRLHPILILIGFRLRANAPEAKSDFRESSLQHGQIRVRYWYAAAGV